MPRPAADALRLMQAGVRCRGGPPGRPRRRLRCGGRIPTRGPAGSTCGCWTTRPSSPTSASGGRNPRAGWVATAVRANLGSYRRDRHDERRAEAAGADVVVRDDHARGNADGPSRRAVVRGRDLAAIPFGEPFAEGRGLLDERRRRSQNFRLIDCLQFSDKGKSLPAMKRSAGLRGSLPGGRWRSLQGLGELAEQRGALARHHHQRLGNGCPACC